MRGLKAGRCVCALAVTVAALGSSYEAAAANIATYSDKSAFLAETGASDATGPLPSLGLGSYGSITIGTVKFNISRFSITDISARLPGLEIGISDGANGASNESIDTLFAAPVFSAGFDFVEPQFDPHVNRGFTDSTFQVTLKSGAASVSTFSFNAPNDVAAFVGVWSDTAFDKLEIREIVGTDDNEFYGRFYTGTAPLPEPTTLSLLAVMGGFVGHRRRK